MSAEQLLAVGNLDEALKVLKEAVRKDAANARHRIFLFQLLAVQGDWARALTQLEVSGDLDPVAQPMVQTYRSAIRCELLRAEIFAGRRSPLVFGDPEQWLALLLQALRQTASGHFEEAGRLREQAFSSAPTCSGKIGEDSFDWIADADPRLGPVMEVIMEGRYYWVPFHRVQSVRLEPPADLRDLVWMPASFTWSNGGESVGLVPTRYPGSEQSADPLIRLARKTEWQQLAADTYLGSGQRMFTTDTGDYPLMDIRNIQLVVANAADAIAGRADG